MPRPAPRRSSTFETEHRQGPLDPGRQPRRDQDLQQDDRWPSWPSARPGFDFRGLFPRRRRRRRRADRRPAERGHRHRRADRARRRSAVLKDQLLVRSLDTYADVSAQGVRRREFRFLRHDPVGHAGAASRAGSAAVDFTTGALARRCRQALRRSAISRPKPRRRPTSWSATSSPRWAGGSTSSTGWRPRPRPRPTPSSPPSRPRSAIPSQWRDYSALEIRRDDLLGNAHARQPVRLRLQRRQARQADLPLGMGHDPDDGQRLCQFRHGRDRLPGRDPAAAVLRSAMPTRRSITAASARSSATRSATISTTRAPNMTRRASSPTGGPRRTSPHFKRLDRRARRAI